MIVSIERLSRFIKFRRAAIVAMGEVNFSHT